MASNNKALGEQLNALRAQLGMKPYSSPEKKGTVLLTTEIYDLTERLKARRELYERGVQRLADEERVKVLAGELPVEMPAPQPIEQPTKPTEQQSAPPPVEQPTKPAEAAPTKGRKPTSFVVTEQLDKDALLRAGEPETIRAMSERLLLHVHKTDESDRRTVGLMYATIIALVREKFPKAQTSIECLRWYAVHMRAEEKRLPQKRPRPLVRG